MSAVSSSKFLLFWKNSASQLYSRWDVDSSGVSSNAVLTSSDEFVVATVSFQYSAGFTDEESLGSSSINDSSNVIYLAGGISGFVVIGAISAVVIIRKRRRSVINTNSSLSKDFTLFAIEKKINLL
jgi:hypothetical protein